MDYEPYHSGVITLLRNAPMEYNVQTLEWVKPDEIFACVISLKKKYAQALLDNGILKFNSPENWIKYGIENTTGKGDILEGSFEAIKVPLGQKNFVWENHYAANIHAVVVKYSDYELLHLKNEAVIKLPCYCFYIIKNKHFKIQVNNKKMTASAKIPSRYFRGLEDGRSWLEEQNLDEQERMVSVIISDIDEFLARIKNTLLNLGIENKAFLMRQVKYEDLSKPYEKKRNHPMELFVKDMQFSDQSEGRIVINTKNMSLRDRLINETISIGSIRDIAYLDDHYYSGGLTLEMTSYIH